MSFSLTRNRIQGPGFRQQRLSVFIPTSFTNQLQGYWKFNGNGSDSSDKGRDLTYTGTEAYGTGLLGQSYSLTGSTSDFASRGSNDTIFDFSPGTPDFTIQVWIKFNALAGEQTIIEKFTGGAGPGWTLTKLSDNTYLFGTGSGEAVTSPASTAVADGSFHQIIIRRESTLLELFYDNSSLDTDASGGVFDVTTKSLLLGERDGGQSFPVDGDYDETAIWTRALTNDEILVLYNNGAGLALF